MKLIVENRKARFEYFLEETITMGVMLEGWEVKAIRAGRIQMDSGYVLIKDGELFLTGARIDPLLTASKSVVADPARTRKLLAKKKEIERWVGKVERSGYTLVPVNFHFGETGIIKVDVSLAKGKKNHDKRETIKEREWKVEQGRILRNSS